MQLSPSITTCIETASAKALATTGPHGVNVVPVSVITINQNGTIWLYDFFMGKTAANLQTEPTVALTCWSDMTGVQVKATATYSTSGEEFTTAEMAMREQFPERTLKGLIILTPTTIFDVSPGGAFLAKDLHTDS